MFRNLALFLAATACFAASASDAGTRPVLSEPGIDICIPQIAVGANWKTTITLMNMGSQDAEFLLLFYSPEGKAVQVPIRTPGANVTTNGLAVALGPNGSIALESANPVDLTQAFGLIVHNGMLGTKGTIAGYAVFQQQVQGRPPFEAVVPFSPISEKRVKLAFDNVGGYQTGVALVNPDTVDASIVAYVYDERGSAIARHTFIMPRTSQKTFVLGDQIPATKGIRGVVEFATSAYGMCSLGLRFHPQGAFTSAPPLSLPSW